jgi:hypothetical protein
LPALTTNAPDSTNCRGLLYAANNIQCGGPWHNAQWGPREHTGDFGYCAGQCSWSQLRCSCIAGAHDKRARPHKLQGLVVCSEQYPMWGTLAQCAMGPRDHTGDCGYGAGQFSWSQVRCSCIAGAHDKRARLHKLQGLVVCS